MGINLVREIEDVNCFYPLFLFIPFFIVFFHDFIDRFTVFFCFKSPPQTRKYMFCVKMLDFAFVLCYYNYGLPFEKNTTTLRVACRCG